MEALARLVITAPRRVLLVAGLLMMAASVLGGPAAQVLSPAGFADPAAESTKAARLLADTFKLGDASVILLVSGESRIDDRASSAAVTDLVDRLRDTADVVSVVSPWESDDPVAAGLVSRDGRSAVILVGVSGGEIRAPARAAELAAEFTRADNSGLQVIVGGSGILQSQITEQIGRDLTTIELVVLPVTFLVLIWVFGGVTAAFIPLTVGGFAILGSIAVLRVIGEITDVSVFALNLAVAIGLALAIDYSLLIVSRYREEVGAGAQPPEAVRRTLVSAGRTIVYSAITVSLCLAVTAVFPMYFLRSFAYGGVAVVVLAALAALTIVPAAVLVAAHRIDKSVRSADLTRSRWYRFANRVAQRPVRVIVATVIPLMVLALPFLDARFGLPDDRILPTSASARQTGDAMRADFNQDLGSAIQVVIPDTTDLPEVAIDDYAGALSRVPGTVVVSAPHGTFRDGVRIGPPSGQAGLADGSAYLTVATLAAPFSPEADRMLDALHAVPAPTGATAWFSGMEQTNRDTNAAIADRLPIALLLMAAVMFGLLFMLTGSVVIPLKALLLNALSLTATFGAMVWIFQQGHLGGLGTTVTGILVASVPVLMFCVAFGLSMDYEVFLIARMREFWLESDRSSAASREAVALGLASTSRVVTAAAGIMAITFAALIASQVSFIRNFGVGLTLAVLVDATVIRMLLLPASMNVLGRWNWWAPAPLARLHARITRGAPDPEVAVQIR